jgi:hypothetical protein
MVLALAPCSASAAAATLSVQSTADDAGTAGCTQQSGGYSCQTLRDAVQFADSGAAGSSPTIELGTGVYDIDGQLDVNAPTPITIYGSGSEGSHPTTITEGGTGRVILASSSLTLSSLHVAGGNIVGTDGASEYGGGIYVDNPSAALDLSNVVLSGNTVEGGDVETTGDGGGAQGGAVFSGGSVDMTDSTITQNSADGGSGLGTGSSGGTAMGGGIDADDLTVTDSTITQNYAIGGGDPYQGGAGSGSDGGQGIGGGLVAAGQATVTGSAINGNSASGGQGSPGDMTGATQAGNGGPAMGGAIYTAKLKLDTSLVESDAATGGTAGQTWASGAQPASGGLAEGGGIEQQGPAGDGPIGDRAKHDRVERCLRRNASAISI